MKILQVIPNLLSGGAESFTMELATELCRQDYECDVVTLFDMPENNEKVFKLNKITNVFSLQKKTGFDIKCCLRLYNFIKARKYDVVHAHVGAIPYLLLSCVLLRRVRFVATIHSDASFEAGNKLMKLSRQFMFKMKLCTPVTISEASQISFRNFYHMDAPMIYNGVSIYSGTGIPPLRDNDDQILFIHPASCQDVKNQRLLFTAFAKLAEDIPNIKLLWIGSKSSYPALFEDLKKIITRQIKYVGVVSNVRDYLAQADAMCLSSKMEGMPMTIIEAFSVGCPALCTPVGGIVNMVVNSKNGLLSENMSVEAYYEMLKLFINMSNNERKNMRDEARKSFEKYAISTCAERYIEVYKR